MKKILLITGILMINPIFGQEFLNKVVTHMCDCPELQQENPTEDNFTMCMVDGISKNKEVYKKEFGKEFSFDDDTDFDGEKLGELMMLQCPKIFYKMTLFVNSMDTLQATSDYEDIPSITIVGKIMAIEKNQFNTIKVKDTKTNGTIDLLWLFPFENWELLTQESYKWQNKNFNISYYITELYNPKTNNYEPYNIIEYLDPIKNR